MEDRQGGPSSPSHSNNDDLEERLFGRLGVAHKEQDALERDLMDQADAAMREKDDAADEKRLRKTAKDLASVQQRLNDLQRKRNSGMSIRESLNDEIETARKKVIELKEQEQNIRDRMLERETDSAAHGGARHRSSAKEDRERLIQLGKITPFAAGGFERRLHQSRESAPEPSAPRPGVLGRASGDSTEEEAEEEMEPPSMHVEKRRLRRNDRGERLVDDDDGEEDYSDGSQSDDDDDDDEEAESESDRGQGSDAEDILDFTSKRRRKRLKAKKSSDLRYVDDGNEMAYEERLEEWAKRRRRRRLRNEGSTPVENENGNLDTELHMPSPYAEDAHFDKGYRCPGEIWSELFEYQRTGVKWLWELHDQDVGGIIGDEMGLGKTVQIIAFLAGLSNSRLMDGPVLVVCPATVMKQWTQEFHKWWPPFRVVILHSSGSGMAKSRSVTTVGSDDDDGVPVLRITNDAAKGIVNTIFAKGHVLITTYESVKQYRHLLLKRRWGYVVLDEGHKIRNPDAEITLTCKQLLCNHRILMTGTPIQNNLVELWSLMDFVFPGRLGTLPVFQNEFAIPIRLGGYANASNVQVQAAYKCATVLRDLVTPYLLRRLKVNVASQLPKKTEQVLFCSLSESQRAAYERYLKSSEVRAILSGKRHVLAGIDHLRKICNHPDLTDLKRKDEIVNYGDYRKSGKMLVVKALLETWHATGHRVLLFCQTRQMCDILEGFVASGGYKYLRMDGATAIGQRNRMVDEFNSNAEYFVFLLTTKVGGLGINLQSADRVIIFDPDWNPSTDIQARERAWRIGQKKDVAIYRLMMAGTIEEKIYHRQIFKQFLTNKILKDPKQRRFFKSNDLHDLFTLNAEGAKGQTETSGIFADMGHDVEVKLKKRSRSHRDIEKIGNVAKIQPYRTEDDDGEDQPHQSDNRRRPVNNFAEDDDRQILESLFQRKNGVHSALKHDVIMDADNPEVSIVDKEAARIATKAIAALKKSRKSRGSAIDTPTWTGKSGSAGAPGLPRFGKKSAVASSSVGMRETVTGSSATGIVKTSPLQSTGAASSQSLLANLRQNAAEVPTAGEAHDDAGEANEPAVSLAKRVAEFLRQSGGSAMSSAIVSRFQKEVSGQDIAVFKSLLKGIAVKQDGAWFLKEEYQ